MFEFHNNRIYFSALIKSVSTLIKFSLYTSYLLWGLWPKITGWALDPFEDGPPEEFTWLKQLMLNIAGSKENRFEEEFLLEH